MFQRVIFCCQVIVFATVLWYCSPQSQSDQIIPGTEEATSGLLIPDEDLGELFTTVQTSGIFKDSKTFVDCVPKQSPQKTLSLYLDQKDQSDFNLELFVKENFYIPQIPDIKVIDTENIDLTEHLVKQWKYLIRAPDSTRQYSSLLPLPYPFVVPGGRFREIYYWDSYFTMEGLVASGRMDLTKNMIDNFAQLIQNYGHIPNGNRSYYLSRSQPPFFGEMVRLWIRINSPRAAIKYLQPLEKEHDFWMERNGSEQAYKRTVELGGTILNRYYDNKTTPRPESYIQDVEIAEQIPSTDKSIIYRNLRAAAESGWDFSSRWFADQENLSTIQTINIIPVDLNCLLYNLEKTIATLYENTGNLKKASLFTKKAKTRRNAIIKYCWNEAEGIFFDYNFVEQKPTGVLSAAAAYPLYYKIATPQQANKTAESIKQNLLFDGGIVTTINNTSQQWDAPNGWAPLQWIAIVGLRNYGFDELAQTIAERWLSINYRVFKSTGKMMEKYNVHDMSLQAGGGEYALQDGFGWTNGVALALLKMGYTIPQTIPETAAVE